MAEEPSKGSEIDAATKEAWDYLMEVIGDFETFLENIGDLGYSAPQILYYRDEVQEFLEELKDNPQVNCKGAWNKVRELDVQLRKKSQELVDEIGHENFLQYQVINDPPKAHWWWWLNRVTAAPPPPPKVWEFWKYEAFQNKKAEAPAPKVQPKVDERIASSFTLDDVIAAQEEERARELESEEEPS